MVDLLPVGSSVVFFDRLADSSNFHKVRPSSNHGEYLKGHPAPHTWISRCPITPKEPPTLRPMRNHLKVASICLASNANFDNGETGNARERQSGTARYRFPTGGNTSVPFDSLFLLIRRSAQALADKGIA